jgi:hypothetical protein
MSQIQITKADLQRAVTEFNRIERRVVAKLSASTAKPYSAQGSGLSMRAAPASAQASGK